MRRQSRFLAASLTVAFASAAGFAGSADAVVLNTEEISGKPCSTGGVFSTGTGFSECFVDGSPVIIKFNAGLDVEEISERFDLSITGFEFGFTVTGDENSAGFWSYLPGPEDPIVRFWAAKSGPGFILHYLTPDGTSGRENALSVGAPGVSPVDLTWTTPDGKELSHLVFWDTGEVPPPPGDVPEPVSLLLLGAGLLGLGLGHRRKATS